ncbi:MAG: FAD-dependent oxidoreductase [Chloroflexi bacterium]|nr:FAD-dependent oxidoreductase [Chloroflexota bacterium]
MTGGEVVGRDAAGDNTTDYDIVVIGGGLAGLTAGLIAARYGHSTLLLESTAPGGHLLNVEKIEDFPGFPEGVAGFDLCPMVQEQAERDGARFELAEVQGLKPDGPNGRDWRVVTSQGGYGTKAVIVAAGSRPKALGVPGEDRLYGRGVSHCATCDGPLFRGCVVGVVGGGSVALQEALTLAGHASRVILFNREAAFSGQETYRRRVAEHSAIEVRHHAAVEEVLGDGAVTGVRVRDVVTGVESEVELAGLFVYAGLEPNTAFLRGRLRLADDGRVPADAWMRTELPGVFAAGDVRADAPGHAITAAGDGATAAIAAHRYLEARSGRG